MDRVKVIVTAAVVTTAVATFGYSWIKNRYFSLNFCEVDDSNVQQQNDELIEETINEDSDEAEWKAMSDAQEIKTGANHIDSHQSDVNCPSSSSKSDSTENIENSAADASKNCFGTSSTDCNAPLASTQQHDESVDAVDEGNVKRSETNKSNEIIDDAGVSKQIDISSITATTLSPSHSIEFDGQNRIDLPDVEEVVPQSNTRSESATVSDVIGMEMLAPALDQQVQIANVEETKKLHSQLASFELINTNFVVEKNKEIQNLKSQFTLEITKLKWQLASEQREKIAANEEIGRLKSQLEKLQSFSFEQSILIDQLNLLKLNSNYYNKEKNKDMTSHQNLIPLIPLQHLVIELPVGQHNNMQPSPDDVSSLFIPQSVPFQHNDDILIDINGVQSNLVCIENNTIKELPKETKLITATNKDKKQVFPRTVVASSPEPVFPAANTTKTTKEALSDTVFVPKTMDRDKAIGVRATPIAQKEVDKTPPAKHIHNFRSKKQELLDDDSQWKFKVNWLNATEQLPTQPDCDEKVVLIQPYKKSCMKDYAKPYFESYGCN